ncbi:hypothetical protein ABKN59_004588 [Abortiporus biennis]
MKAVRRLRNDHPHTLRGLHGRSVAYPKYLSSGIKATSKKRRGLSRPLSFFLRTIIPFSLPPSLSSLFICSNKMKTTLASIALLASFSASASAAVLSSRDLHLVTRQNVPIDPSTIPAECQDTCSSIETTLNSCSDASCLCTADVNSALASCLSCAATASSDPSTAADTYSGYLSTCQTAETPVSSLSVGAGPTATDSASVSATGTATDSLSTDSATDSSTETASDATSSVPASVTVSTTSTPLTTSTTPATSSRTTISTTSRSATSSPASTSTQSTTNGAASLASFGSSSGLVGVAAAGFFACRGILFFLTD